MLRQLAAVCGGVEALETLSDDPIPDEPFDPSGLTDADRAVAAEILAAIEAAGDVPSSTTSTGRSADVSWRPP